MNSISVESSDAVINAIDVLESGGVIVYPTDTIYGFGVNANDDVAINKLNNIKGRQQSISVLAPDKKTALYWANISDDERKQVEDKLGGHTTVIFPVREGIVCPIILGKDNTLGVRIPRHKFCNTLSFMYSNPITTTSVNKHGSIPLNNPDLIINEFGNDIDLIIVGGNLEGNMSSVVFKLDHGEIIQIR